MKISIFSTHKTKTMQIENLIQNEAFNYGFEIDDNNPDVLFYVGGDGTFLRAVQSNIDRLDELLFIGVNKGKLGYFYDAYEEDINDIFSRLYNGVLVERHIPLLHGVARSEKSEVDFYAVNEILLNTIGGIVNSEVYINDHFFEKYVGSGLILSSAYGSTGINKSFSGPVIKNNLKCNCLTPIAPISNSVYKSFTSSLVLSYDDVVTIKGGMQDALITFDNVTLDDNYDELEISPSSSYVRVLFRQKRGTIHPLRKSFL